VFPELQLSTYSVSCGFSLNQLAWLSHPEAFDGQALVTHTYNLSYSGGRNQEDCGSKPAQAK
jgi:hypothetical protein